VAAGALGGAVYSLIDYAHIPVKVKNWVLKKKKWSHVLTFCYVQPERLIGQSEHRDAHVQRLIASNLKGARN